jgi:hypothetical protein
LFREGGLKVCTGFILLVVFYAIDTDNPEGGIFAFGGAAHATGDAGVMGDENRDSSAAEIEVRDVAPRPMLALRRSRRCQREERFVCGAGGITLR